MFSYDSSLSYTWSTKRTYHEASLAEPTKIKKYWNFLTYINAGKEKKHTDSETRELEDTQSLTTKICGIAEKISYAINFARGTRNLFRKKLAFWMTVFAKVLLKSESDMRSKTNFEEYF